MFVYTFTIIIINSNRLVSWNSASYLLLIVACMTVPATNVMNAATISYTLIINPTFLYIQVVISKLNSFVSVLCIWQTFICVLHAGTRVETRVNLTTAIWFYVAATVITTCIFAILNTI